jgi:hypothetical protein
VGVSIPEIISGAEKFVMYVKIRKPRILCCRKIFSQWNAGGDIPHIAQVIVCANKQFAIAFVVEYTEGQSDYCGNIFQDREKLLVFKFSPNKL